MLPIRRKPPRRVTNSEVFADGHLTALDSPLLIGGIAAVGLLTVAAIFLYGNRRLQANLAKVAVLITIAYAAYGIVLGTTDPAAAQASIEPGVALPVLTVIFAALAARFIAKDERLGTQRGPTEVVKLNAVTYIRATNIHLWPYLLRRDRRPYYTLCLRNSRPSS